MGVEQVKHSRKALWVNALAFAAAGLLTGRAPASGPDVVRSGHRPHIRDQETDCVTCHTTVESSQSAQDRNIPGHDVCFDCHDGDTAPNACQTCHTNPDQARAAPAPVREIKFSHAKHVERGLACTFCHKEVNPNAESEELVIGLPDMGTCFTCHNGQRARVGCETCHTRLAGRLPKDHQAGWTQRHAEVAKSDVPTCAQCHVQEGDCDVCHRGDNLNGLPHQEGFITSHAFTFYSKAKDCGACHDFQVSCVGCHRSRYVYPANHSLANWRERHKGFAATDMESCAACHDVAEPTCVQPGCHRD